MAYSDDAVRAKLSSLNESQDAIVTVAQWIMFHRRHADRTAQLWLARLQESATAKRLNLVYLANEVVQQSRARSKTDFLYAFEPLISDATALAYQGASVDVQGKLKRVVEVWRQRNIFDPNIQTSIEKRLEEADRARGGSRANGIGGAGKLGGSLFGGSGGGVSAELDRVAKASGAVSKAEVNSKSTIATAETEYERMNDSAAVLPTPPVHAARLSALMKNLASAQGAVENCIKARKELVAGLQELLETHKSKLAEEEGQEQTLKSRRESTEEKKREVEDGIMRGLSTPDAATPTSGSGIGIATSTGLDGNHGLAEPTRPEPESFTPPPPDVEAFTPPQRPADDGQDTFALGDANIGEKLLADTAGAEVIGEQAPTLNEPPPTFEPPPAFQQIPQVRQASSDNSGGFSADPRLKRRKMTHSSSMDMDEQIFGSGTVGVDEEGVTALLSSK